MTEKLRLDLPLLLPEIDAGDACVSLLTDELAHTRGVSEAHIVREDGDAKLCLHYDPDLVSLAKIQRLARDAGARITDRYRHETIPLAPLPAADAAASLTSVLEGLPGMLHANVNYAAGVAYVAYDSEKLSRTEIEAAIRSMGVQIATAPAEEEHDHAQGHDHGSAPAFLPHWMQERWTLILVGLAGVFLVIGWAGEHWFGLSPEIALVFYILSYLAGGYDIATHAIPALFRGKFDTDVLMLAAAAGAEKGSAGTFAAAGAAFATFAAAVADAADLAPDFIPGTGKPAAISARAISVRRSWAFLSLPVAS